MTPFARVVSLVGLRWKLNTRPGRKHLGWIAIIVGTLLQLGFAAGLGAFGFGVGSSIVEDEAYSDMFSNPKINYVTLAFFATWGFQVLGAFMIAANDQFLDLSRLLHLPIRHGEIFLATQLSGLISFGELTLISFPVGVAIGIGASPVSVVGVSGIAILSTIAARGFGTATASMIQVLIGRRRLRDITIIITAGFALVPLLLRRKMSEELQSGGSEIAALAANAFFPSAPFARWFVGALGFGDVHVYDILASFVLIVAGLWLSSRAFGRLVRNVDDRQSGERIVSSDERSYIFSAPVGAVMRMTRRLWWRDPRLRAILIQNTLIFGVMGVFGSHGDIRGGAVPPIWLPMVLLFAHGTFMTTQLSIDGPGIGLGFATGVPRFQYVLGRSLGVLCVLIPSSLVILAIPFFMSVIGKTSVPLVDFIPIVVGILIMEATGTALGMLVSVIIPSPALGSAKRREMSGRDGCGRAIVYASFSLPAAICSAPAVLIAVFPWLFHRFHIFGWDAPLHWMFATVPAGLAITGVLAFAFLRAATARLEMREEKIISLVSATG